jgi:RNA polymerase sigma factor (sigma-70 family)
VAIPTLIDCLARFDPAKGHFYTYARRYLERSFVEYFRPWRRFDPWGRWNAPGQRWRGAIFQRRPAAVASLEAAYEADGYEPRAAQSYWAARSERAELREHARCLLQRLGNPRLARVLRMRYFDGATYRQIGQALGLTRETARAWERRGLVQLRVIEDARPSSPKTFPKTSPKTFSLTTRPGDGRRVATTASEGAGGAAGGRTVLPAGFCRGRDGRGQRLIA